jgi:hypothetical protein
MELTIYPSGIVAAFESLLVGELVCVSSSVAVSDAVGDKAEHKGCGDCGHDNEYLCVHF